MLHHFAVRRALRRRHGNAPHTTGQSVFTYLCTPCYETADVCYDVILVSSVVIVCTWATLPVTTAEAERVFSRVERTATAARAHMAEDRLESLIIVQTHRQLTPDIDRVITRFAETGARRLDIIL